ncbi:MAG: hypothetical protein VCG02_04070, partial [Verrucomicrobiota bacterium]
MKKTLGYHVAFLLGAAGAVAEDSARRAERESIFTLEVKPLFVEKCFPCHGAPGKKLKGKFNLTTR